MAGTPPAPAEPAEPAPGGISTFEVFKMYVDAAKWLLAIISGLVVFGLDRLKDHPGLSLALVTFSVSSLLLLGAAVCALNYLRQSFNYVSRTVSAAQQDRAERAHKSADTAYRRMILLFAAGLLVYTVFGGAILREMSLRNDEATVETGPGGLVVARRGPCLWALSPPGPGARWVPLPALGGGRCPQAPS